MVAGDANISVGVLLLKVHENVQKSFLTSSVSCHARNALMCCSSREVDNLLLLAQSLWA